MPSTICRRSMCHGLHASLQVPMVVHREHPRFDHLFVILVDQVPKHGSLPLFQPGQAIRDLPEASLDYLGNLLQASLNISKALQHLALQARQLMLDLAKLVESHARDSKIDDAHNQVGSTQANQCFWGNACSISTEGSRSHLDVSTFLRFQPGASNH